MATVAVVHVPFYSHVGAATRLTALLSRQGHSVIAWAPEGARQRIEATGARFQLHHPPMPRVNGFEAFAASMAEITEQWAGDMVEQLFSRDVDLLVHDSQVPWARVAGDYLGLPRIVLHPMFPIVSPDHLAVDEEHELPAPDPKGELARFQASWLSIALRWGVELGEPARVIHSPGETTFTFTTEEIVGDYELPPGWRC